MNDPRRPRPFVLMLAPALALSYAQLRALPDSPARLLSAVDRMTATATRAYPRDPLFSSAQLRTAIAFTLARGLAEAPTPPRVRAALYRVLASIPGTGVAATLRAFRFTLIIDPSTGALLETGRTLLYRSVQAPGPLAGLINRTFLTSAIVRSAHIQLH